MNESAKGMGASEAAGAGADDGAPAATYKHKVVNVGVHKLLCMFFGYCNNSMHRKDWRCRKRRREPTRAMSLG